MMKNFLTDDRGDNTMLGAIFGLVILCLAAGTVSFLAASTTKSSQAVAHSNRMSAALESAISNAAWSLNTSGTVVTGSSGNMSPNNDTRWEWKFDRPLTGATEILVKATATLGDRSMTRNMLMNSIGVAAKETVGGEVRYVASRALASSYVISGSEVTVTKASWSAASTHLVGKLAVFEGVEKPTVKLQGAPSLGVDAYAKIDKAQGAGGIRQAGVPMILSEKYVKDQAKTCTSRVPVWKSSANGSVIRAGQVICADSIVIDSPTSVTGSGRATLHARNFLAKDDLVSSSSNQVDVWVDGNVDLDLINAGVDKKVRLVGTHIYAGSGKCRTLNSGTGSGLDFSGSIACKRIELVGSFKSSISRVTAEVTYPIWVAKGTQ